MARRARGSVRQGYCEATHQGRVRQHVHESYDDAERRRSATLDFWPYFESIPSDDFNGVDCLAKQVVHVYESAGGRYQHVLVASDRKNVFMVVVLIVPDRAVYGHRLLDLTEEYGLPA